MDNGLTCASGSEILRDEIGAVAHDIVLGGGSSVYVSYS